MLFITVYKSDVTVWTICVEGDDDNTDLLVLNWSVDKRIVLALC